MTEGQTITGVRAEPVPFLDLGRSRPDPRGSPRRFPGLTISGAFTNGPQVAEFEHAFAAYCGAAHCIGLASGLDALRLALSALGIGAGRRGRRPGDDVRRHLRGGQPSRRRLPCRPTCRKPTTASTRPQQRRPSGPTRGASCRSISTAGLPTWRRSRGVAAAHGLSIVEDACQAHGAQRDGVGAGDALGAPPRSASIRARISVRWETRARSSRTTTSSRQLVRALREHGQRGKYEHDAIGWTSRLDTIQAAVPGAQAAAPRRVECRTTRGGRSLHRGLSAT